MITTNKKVRVVNIKKNRTVEKIPVSKIHSSLIVIEKILTTYCLLQLSVNFLEASHRFT